MTTNETGQPDAVAAAVLERHARHEKSHRPGLNMCSGCYQPWPCDAAVLAREVERLRAVAYAAERVYYCYYNDAVSANLRTNYTPAFLESITSLRTALEQMRDDTPAE
jgi:hypothetical protein